MFPEKKKKEPITSQDQFIPRLIYEVENPCSNNTFQLTKEVVIMQKVLLTLASDMGWRTRLEDGICIKINGLGYRGNLSRPCLSLKILSHEMFGRCSRVGDITVKNERYL